MKLAHTPLLTACCLLCVLLALGFCPIAQAANFGNNAQANVKTFFSDKGWFTSMKFVAQWNDEHGMLGCYTALNALYEDCMSTELRQIDVLEMKSIVALAAYLMIDQIFAEKELENSTLDDMTIMMLEEVINNHKQNSEDIISPHGAYVNLCRHVGLNMDEMEELLFKLSRIFQQVRFK